MGQSELPTALAAYQNQCYAKDDTYTGFQCPKNNPRCPLKRGDNYPDMISALRAIRHLMELAHRDDSRFSRTRSTLPDQVTVKCIACHTEEHANDASACRGKRT